MILTNKMNLPEAIVRAVENDPYSRGDSDISVTQLIGPPLVYLLREEHDEDIVEDVSDRIWALLGSAVHNILEQAAGPNELVERRYFATTHGWVWSGQFDHLDLRDGCLSDYKVTSVWSIVNGGKEDWVKQLNLLAHLLRIQEGGLQKKVKRLQIVAILRDWSKKKAQTDKSYPQSNIITIPIEIWPESVCKSFLEERVMLHQGCRILADTGDFRAIPECSKEERWEKDTKWAIMKKGNKRAVKLHESEKKAKEHLDKLDKKHYIQVRKGERTRCEGYCAAAKFCSYFQESK